MMPTSIPPDWWPVEKRPWDGCFPADLANKLREQFGFRPGYDLEDKLSEVTWRFQRRLPMNEAISQARSELQQARKTDVTPSLFLILYSRLWKLNNPRKAQGRDDAAVVKAAARDDARRKRKPGAPIDLRTTAVYRSLGAIYREGTGKVPRIGGWSGSFRGNGYRFAKAVCGFLKAPAGLKLAREIWVNTQDDIRRREQYDRDQKC